MFIALDRAFEASRRRRQRLGRGSAAQPSPTFTRFELPAATLPLRRRRIMTHIQLEGRCRWENYHRTIAVPAADCWRFIEDGSQVDAPAYLAQTASEIGALLERTHAANRRLRPTGATWSFNDILEGADTFLRVETRNRIFRVPRDVRASSLDARLVLASAGTTLHELNAAIEPRWSLFTSGAHDGQTLGGLLGTGTHGSVPGFGAFQNQVRGVHLVTGPKRSLWIERGPDAILKPDFARSFSDEIVLDPDTFDAVLVHLGGLGVLNAVLLELSEGYMLDFVQRKHVLEMKHLEMLQEGAYRDFARAVWSVTAEDPYYLQVILDPYRPYKEFPARQPSPALITLMFKRPTVAELLRSPAQPTEHDPLNLLPLGLRDKGSPELFAPGRVAFIAVENKFRVTPGVRQPPERKTWGQANGPHAKQILAGLEIEFFNAAYAIPRPQLTKILPTMLRAFNESSLAPAVFTLRFVSNAAGLLPFTRFPETVVVNLDGARNLPPIGKHCAEAARRVAWALQHHDHPFSQHWGKQGVISRTRFVREFGDPGRSDTPAGRWRAVRGRLLTAAMRQVLTSPALERWGLA
jgi:hypothetical protein